MRIGIATYRALSALLLILLVLVVWLATDGRIKEAGIGLAAMVAVAIGQALMLRCQHCGARPGLWILAIYTAFLSPEFYFADALFLRKCFRCRKSLSVTKEASGAV
jgi:hypothetical protein